MTRMSALLLDEDSLEGGTCTTISDHNLLRVVKHLWIVDTTRAWILVLANAACKLLHLCLAHHIALPVLVDALGALDSFLIYTVSLNRWCHGADLLVVLSLHRTSRALSLQSTSVGIRSRLIQALKIVRRSAMLSEVARVVVVTHNSCRQRSARETNVRAVVQMLLG